MAEQGQVQILGLIVWELIASSTIRNKDACTCMYKQQQCGAGSGTVWSVSAGGAGGRGTGRLHKERSQLALRAVRQRLPPLCSVAPSLLLARPGPRRRRGLVLGRARSRR
jgi:hypothetical protein